MKSSVFIISSALTVLALSVRAEEHPPHVRVLTETREPGREQGNRMFIRHGEHKGEKETVTFLGVETAPAGPALAAQLGLVTDTGLVIRHVVPDSPAAGALQVHDVIVKIDDQVLIEPHQFSVLIRNHKSGDEITVSFVRAGKMSTAKLKLAQHEVPKFAVFGIGHGDKDYFDFAVPPPPDGGLPGEGDVDHVLSLLEPDDRHPGVAHHEFMAQPFGPGFKASTVDTGNSTMSMSDDEGALELTIKAGKKTLVAKDPKGTALFSGPINTTEERQAMPAAIRKRLEKLEGMQEFEFRTGEGVERDVKILRPGPTKMVIPVRHELSSRDV